MTRNYQIPMSIGAGKDGIDTPALLIDLDVLERNIKMGWRDLEHNLTNKEEPMSCQGTVLRMLKTWSFRALGRKDP
jgi:hypothetical protein